MRPTIKQVLVAMILARKNKKVSNSTIVAKITRILEFFRGR
ncbi:MAG TPA: hypothetical protein VJB58_01885 [Candidatus Paceibacterota bacterium]